MDTLDYKGHVSIKEKLASIAGFLNKTLCVPRLL